jgi:hypothetical protein
MEGGGLHEKLTVAQLVKKLTKVMKPENTKELS